MTSLAMILICSAGVAAQEPLVFDRQLITPRIFEAASVFDVNRDKKQDIVSGEYWYEGPDFTQEHRIGDVPVVGEYYDDFSCYPMDINGDGWTDFITGGFFGCELRWRENPKDSEKEWPLHVVAKTGNIERACFYDIDGDKKLEVFPVTKPVEIFKLDCKRNGKGKGKGTFTRYAIDKGNGGHGFGCGDVNGDGRPDVILSGGWIEAPAKTYDADTWVWHDEFNLGAASVPILVYDVNGDGKNDLIVGEGHNFGLYWLEQGMDGGKRTWTKHMIETSRSQYHDVQLCDLDNDGQPELVTGKRYRAHNGHDPGDWDPLGLYYFKIGKGQFERVTIDYGDPKQASGAGIYFWVADMDGNGWPDIVAPGKQGLYLFKNQGR